jgi:UDP-glucose 4-epimerase
MDKIGITGGAGFIGSNLSNRLISDGYRVVIVDDLSSGLASNIDLVNSEFQNVSVTDEVSLKKALKGCKTIFHLAARGSVPRSIKFPIQTHNVNATGTLNVLEIARSSNAHVIFSSSSSVYGRNMQLPKNEKMWTGPMTPYAASKLAAEGYCDAFSSTYQLQTTILRFFNVFGPRQRPDHEYAAVLPKWIWLAMHNKPVELYGDGITSRDFTYVDTVLDVMINAMKERVNTIGPVNVAYGNRIQLKQVLDLLKREFPNIEIQNKSERLGDVKESQNDPQLLLAKFPKVNPKAFEDALLETIAWLKNFGSTVANGPKVVD